ncbi:MAG TPA: acyltransferase [Steroidobacteraceae bacterium]|nr:acyltransferase [Steroidobacteraceae bacterium]
MTRLDEFRGRDNNFNLIRLLAAVLVIWTHAAFGAMARGHIEAAYRFFGLRAGDIGVDVFFILSGFLVSKSLDGKTLAEFAWARCMRIYPALWVSITVSLVLVALVFSDQPALRFLTSGSTVAYLARNATLIHGAQLTLPHAFAHVDGEFNVSLWTLPFEVKLYGLLAVLGMTLGLRARYVAALAAIGAAGILLQNLAPAALQFGVRGRFLYLFFAGALAYTLRRRIVLRTWLAVALAAAVAATVAVTSRYSVRQAALLLALPYLLLWLGLVPRGGPLRLWNRLGDYSYGMYIYAYPVHIALSSMGAAVTVEGNFLLTTLITLPIAIVSWHALEKRALRRSLPAWIAHTFARRVPTAAE